MPFYASAEVMIDSAWQLNQKEIKRLQAGKTVTHASSGEGNVTKLDAFLLFNAPAPVIFSVITDYEKQPEFMPNLAEIKVLETSNKGALVNYMLELPFGVEKRYRLKLDYNQQSPNLRMDWNLSPWEGLKPEETILASTGYWLLKPVQNTNDTLLVYHTSTDPGDVPFGLGWIVDYMTNKTVVELLEKTKKRAETTWENNKNHSN